MISFHNIRDLSVKAAAGIGHASFAEISIHMETTVDICLYVPSDHDEIAHQKLAAIVKLLKEWPPAPLVAEEVKAADPSLPSTD